tara:strand:- start:226 stop:660 length:435 start_codon:yes stop_codon:yes gene_type:complete
MLIKYPNYKELIGSFFELNVVRLQKLLHMSQNAIFTAIFCFFIGVKLNSLFEVKGEEEAIITSVSMGLLQMVVIILSVYYIRKLTKLIPFLFRFTESYNPFHKSKDGEGLVGSAIAMGLLLISTQSNMKERIEKLITYVEGDKE